MGSAVWSIAGKDLRQRARDKSLFILAFVAPLALAFVFNMVFGGLDSGGDRIRFEFGVVDDDGGELAQGFLDLLSALEADGLIEVTTFPDIDTARSAVDDDDVAAAIVLPTGLSEAFATNSTNQIQVIGSVDAPIATSVARSLARGFVTQAGTGTLAGVTAAASGVAGPDQIAEIANEVSATGTLARLTTIETDSAPFDLTTMMVVGLSVFFVFFVAGTAVTGVLEERSNGTLPRLLASPIARASIILGKALAAIVAGIAALVALMIASTLIMGADWGHPLGAVMLASVAVLAATGIMSMVGGLAKTAEQAGNLQAIVAVSMAMLGGSFGLLAPPGDTLWGRLALLTPNRWFVRGIDDLATGGITDALPAVGVLLAMALVTGTIAASLAGRVLRG